MQAFKSCDTRVEEIDTEIIKLNEQRKIQLDEGKLDELKETDKRIKELQEERKELTGPPKKKQRLNNNNKQNDTNTKSTEMDNENKDEKENELLKQRINDLENQNRCLTSDLVLARNETDRIKQRQQPRTQTIYEKEMKKVTLKVFTEINENFNGTENNEEN